jgi:WD40 repeat protein
VIEAAPTEARTTPYKGLTNYTEGDEAYFFGRVHEREIIVSSLKARRLTLLYGESGVGKTSMLRAGVVATLRAQARRDAADESFRTRAGRPLVEYVPVIFSAWRDDPIEGLADAIRTAMRDLVDPSYEPPPTRRLDEMIDAAAAHTDGYLLLVLDQFEEYFLYHGDEAGPGTFADEFVRAVKRPGLAAGYLVSIREDALAKLDRFKREIPKLFDSSIRVSHLNTAAAREAIVSPIEQYNRDNPEKPPVVPEPLLVEAVLQQVRAGEVVLEQSGRGTINGDGRRARQRDEIETPYLQLVMTRLWEKEMDAGSPVLQLETLKELGGATEIVRTHLDNKLSQLPLEQRDTASDIFHHLVTPSGTKIAHAVPDLAHYSDHSEAEVSALLERLAAKDSRIVRGVPAPPNEAGPPRYEIFHDVLAGAILDWRTRQTKERLEREKAAAEQRESVQRREKIEAKARERQAKRRAKLLLALSVGLVVIGLLIVVKIQSDNAGEQRAASQSSQLAANALEAPDLELPSLLALEAYRTSPTFDARSAMLKLAGNHEIGKPFGGGSVGVMATAYNRDGTILVTGRSDGTVQLFDVATHRLLATPPRQHTPLPVNDVEFSPDGKTFATAGADHAVLLWSVADPAAPPKPLLGHTRAVNSIAFSPDSKRLASASEDATLRVWNLASGKGRRMTGRSGPINEVAFSRDGHTLASGSCHKVLHDDIHDHAVRLWDVRTGRQFGRLAGHTLPVCAVAFSPDGKMLASGGDDTTVRLWDVGKRSQIGSSLIGHTDYVHQVAFSRDGTAIASAGVDRTVRLWDVAKGTQIGGPLANHTARVDDVAFNPKQDTLASAALDGVRLWSLADPSQIGAPLVRSKAAVFSIAASPDGRKLAWIDDGATARHGTAHVWDLASRRDTRASAPIGNINGLAFSPDSKTIAIAAKDRKSVWAWDPANQRAPTVLVDPPRNAKRNETVKAVAFSPDGKTLAYGYNKVLSEKKGTFRGKVRLWDVQNNRTLPSLPGGHEGEVHGIAFSPDGKLLASGGDDGLVRVWDLERHRQIASLAGHTDHVNGVAFSPDSRTIASASVDQTVRLWNVKTRHQIGVSMGRPGFVDTVAFDPRDGKTIVSAGGHGIVQVWDVRVQRPLGGSFAGHTDTAFGAAFTPDGRMIASGSGDGTVRLWRSPSHVASARERLCAYIDTDSAEEAWNRLEPSIDFKPPC